MARTSSKRVIILLSKTVSVVKTQNILLRPESAASLCFLNLVDCLKSTPLFNYGFSLANPEVEKPKSTYNERSRQVFCYEECYCQTEDKLI